jgi:hypothetical protein
VLLELAKAVSFFCCVLSLLPVLMSAFFEPDTSWEERLVRAAVKLAIAAGVSVCSGLVFTWPSRTNPEAGVPLLSTLPMRVFLWTAMGLGALFFVAWYARCGGDSGFSLKHDCF